MATEDEFVRQVRDRLVSDSDRDEESESIPFTGIELATLCDATRMHAVYQPDGPAGDSARRIEAKAREAYERWLERHPF